MAERRRSAPSSPGDQDRAFSSATQPAWLTVEQVCGRWQLGRKTVYKFITSKILPAWKVGPHLYRIALDDVLRFEAENTSFADSASDTKADPSGDKSTGHL